MVFSECSASYGKKGLNCIQKAVVEGQRRRCVRQVSRGIEKVSCLFPIETRIFLTVAFEPHPHVFPCVSYKDGLALELGCHYRLVNTQRPSVQSDRIEA